MSQTTLHTANFHNRSSASNLNTGSTSPMRKLGFKRSDNNKDENLRGSHNSSLKQIGNNTNKNNPAQASENQQQNPGLLQNSSSSGGPNYMNPIPNPHNLDLGLDSHGHYNFNGTPMLSRAGLSTIPQYLCFQQNNPQLKQRKDQDEESKEKLKLYIFDDDQLDLTAFKKEYDEIQEKQQKLVDDKEQQQINVKNSVSRSKWLWKLRLNSKQQNTSSFLTFNRYESAVYKISDQTTRNQSAANFMGTLYIPKPIIDDYKMSSLIKNQNFEKQLRYQRSRSANSPNRKSGEQSKQRPQTAFCGRDHTIPFHERNPHLSNNHLHHYFRNNHQPPRKQSSFMLLQKMQIQNASTAVDSLNQSIGKIKGVQDQQQHQSIGEIKKYQSSKFNTSNVNQSILVDLNTSIIRQQRTANYSSQGRDTYQTITNNTNTLNNTQQNLGQQLHDYQHSQRHHHTNSSNINMGNKPQNYNQQKQHHNWHQIVRYIGNQVEADAHILNQIERNKIKATTFDKTTDRENCKHARKLSQPSGPHEQRFVSFKTINTHNSKYQDPNQYPAFSRQVGGHEFMGGQYKHQNKTLFLHDYDPNYDKVKSRINISIPNFQKQQGRVQSAVQKQKVDIQNKSTIDPSQVDTSYKLLSHVKREMCVPLDKFMGRKEDFINSIYLEKDQQVLLNRQYESYARAIKQAASSSIQRHKDSQKMSSGFNTIVGGSSPHKSNQPANFDIEFYESDFHNSLNVSPTKFQRNLLCQMMEEENINGDIMSIVGGEEIELRMSNQQQNSPVQNNIAGKESYQSSNFLIKLKSPSKNPLQYRSTQMEEEAGISSPDMQREEDIELNNQISNSVDYQYPSNIYVQDQDVSLNQNNQLYSISLSKKINSIQVVQPSTQPDQEYRSYINTDQIHLHNRFAPQTQQSSELNTINQQSKQKKSDKQQELPQQQQKHQQIKIFTKSTLLGKEMTTKVPQLDKYFTNSALSKHSQLNQSLIGSNQFDNTYNSKNRGDEVHLKMYQKAQKIMKATQQIEEFYNKKDKMSMSNGNHNNRGRSVKSRR